MEATPDITQKGWNYISTLFNILLRASDCNDFIEPQYIYRGETKRHFSRSIKIERRLMGLEPEKRKKQSEIEYNRLYNALKKNWFGSCHPCIGGNNIKGEKIAIDALDKIIDSPSFKEVRPEFIKSGAAVRLQETINEQKDRKTAHIDYVNYIKHMINDIKSRYPRYVDENYSDIEILADIQHKGAASCLVDFSNNFLTSLWFATNDDSNDFGYLFCYDINKALLDGNKLFVLNLEQDANKPISELLYSTTKSAKYTSKPSHRFWLWKPSNLNERIARQDSIFLFGIEAFVIDEHEIITIPIPPTWKEPIQHVLKSYLGVSAESIYCDVEGYADANAKTKHYTRTLTPYYRQELFNGYLEGEDTNFITDFQNGLACLYQCEYELALKYFTQYESEVKESLLSLNQILSDDIVSDCHIRQFVISTELHYSKALCLKHLNASFGAIRELRLVLDNYAILTQTINKKGKELIKQLTSKYMPCIKNKFHKAINDLIDVYYDTKNYDGIKETLDLIFPPKELDQLGAKWSRMLALKETVYREVECMKAMNTFIHNNEKKLAPSQQEPISYVLSNYENVRKESQPFYYVLNLYFNCLMAILKEDSWEVEKSTLKEEIFVIKESEITDSKKIYTNWKFKYLIKYFQQIKNIDERRYAHAMEATALMNDFRNYIQGKTRIEPW